MRHRVDIAPQALCLQALNRYGPTILRHADVVQRVPQSLGARCVGLFAGVIPHAPVEIRQDAVAAAAACQPQALVSVGGGSSHDTAKGMATLLAQGGRIHDYEPRFEPPDTVIFPDFSHDKISVIAVPSILPQAFVCIRLCLGAPGSSPAPEATLERGVPRSMHKNSWGDALDAAPILGVLRHAW